MGLGLSVSVGAVNRLPEIPMRRLSLLALGPAILLAAGGFRTPPASADDKPVVVNFLGGDRAAVRAVGVSREALSADQEWFGDTGEKLRAAVDQGWRPPEREGGAVLSQRRRPITTRRSSSTRT